jgi:hypothetical protein
MEAHSRFLTKQDFDDGGAFLGGGRGKGGGGERGKRRSTCTPGTHRVRCVGGNFAPPARTLQLRTERSKKHTRPGGVRTHLKSARESKQADMRHDSTVTPPQHSDPSHSHPEAREEEEEEEEISC